MTSTSRATSPRALRSNEEGRRAGARPQHAARIVDGLTGQPGATGRRRADRRATPDPRRRRIRANPRHRLPHRPTWSAPAWPRSASPRRHLHQQGGGGDAARVSNILGNDARGLWISTFHALCAKLLRREGPAIGLGRDFVIYDTFRPASAIKQAIEDVNADDKLISAAGALSRISQAKNQMWARGMAGSVLNFRDQQIAKVYERYVALLQRPR